MTMAEIKDLMQRIDAEFSGMETRLKSLQAEQVREYQGRRDRMERLNQVFEQLREIWRPRLEALAAKFGDKVKVTPLVAPSMREATFKFQSNLARIALRFSAGTDHEVRNLILSYDLEILPVLMRFDSHSELSIPLDNVAPDTVAAWVDDRIVGFVKTYLSLHENDLYLKDVMVEDPVANVRFPKFAAAATLEHAGKTYYFLGEETRNEFAKPKKIEQR
jgi:YHS domain-containing protein